MTEAAQFGIDAQHAVVPAVFGVDLVDLLDQGVLRGLRLCPRASACDPAERAMAALTGQRWNSSKEPAVTSSVSSDSAVAGKTILSATATATSRLS
ncbi:hypothetical protein [Streptomyces sp. NPDC058394]|uniref:hypothetical protein n=1 Tax=Streptomyces sp. NPDC058394 TaxID=3346477 RepID=UPI00364CDA84